MTNRSRIVLGVTHDTVHQAGGGEGASLWNATLQETERFHGSRDPHLGNDLDVDVAIVGAGFTGLWTAHYLAEQNPDLTIAVIEQQTVGFGASGRNGGWCSALLPMSLAKIASRHGRDAAIELQRTMHGTVSEVSAVCRHLGIDAGIAHGGTVMLARGSHQVGRVRAELDEYRHFGFSDEDYRWLQAAEAAEQCNATHVMGASFTPHCLAIHPARLAHGLARSVADRGVRIIEHTRVTDIAPRRLVTDSGSIRASAIVRATEGYTSALPGHRRDIVPLYSLMIATEPLSESVWSEIGLHSRPTFDDGRHLLVYGQRTADGRLAFGGRGAPYHFGSKIDPRYDTDARVRGHLTSALRNMFPMLATTSITHHWGGPLGVPRDWSCSVNFDRETGLGAAGGYVGDGVATSNLAGRTLAALIAGTDDPLIRLPWVSHHSPNWEPEPLRWLGINAGRRTAALADRTERRTGRPSKLWATVNNTMLRR